MQAHKFTWPRMKVRLPTPWLKSWVPRRHWRRYILGWLISIVGIAGLAGGYAFFWPKSYTSEWTLILPGAGAGSNVNVSSIGQSSSIIASPFGQSSLSPMKIYKAIAEADSVREAAAKTLGLELPQFGKPRVKLLEQTALMIFSINGATPELAAAKANALHAALEAQLNILRRDEIERRAQAVNQNLVHYSSTLAKARQNVLEYQQRTGLVSISQFNDLALTVEQLQRKLDDAGAEAARLEAHQTMLMRDLGLDSMRAAQAIALAANPSFVKILREYADARNQLGDKGSRYGQSHPQFVRELARANGLEKSVQQILRSAGAPLEGTIDVNSLIDTPARAELFQSLVRGNAELWGKRQQMREIEAQLQRSRSEVERRTSHAVQLENLQKKQLVAEAVYSSAVARVDTNRADIYASYPLVQVLASPTLPERPSGPRLLFAAIGFLLGSFLATGAWFLAWLYQMFVLRRLKSA
jgi:uncharacterized protein involved in exopolysaccharide biosynthesis